MKALALISPVLILTLALLFAPAHAGSWDEENTRLHVPLTFLMIVDYGQTLYIADHPDKYSESNGMMGDHPSRKEVREYFVLYYLTATGLTWVLPAKWSHWYQRGVITMEIYSTVNNKYIGVGFSF